MVSSAMRKAALVQSSTMNALGRLFASQKQADHEQIQSNDAEVAEQFENQQRRVGDGIVRYWAWQISARHEWKNSPPSSTLSGEARDRAEADAEAHQNQPAAQALQMLIFKGGAGWD